MCCVISIPKPFEMCAFIFNNWEDSVPVLILPEALETSTLIKIHSNIQYNIKFVCKLEELWIVVPQISGSQIWENADVEAIPAVLAFQQIWSQARE